MTLKGFETTGLHGLQKGDVTAVVSARAASLRSLVVDGTELVEPTMTRLDPPGMAGAILAPWPNRVEGGRWRRGNHDLQLAVTEPELGHANHGLLARTDFALVTADLATVVLRGQIDEPPGYPFRLVVVAEYRLVDAGIEVILAVQNIGDGPAPVAFGAHPYLRVGDTPTDRLTLHLDADTAHVLDDTHIPRERFAVEGTSWELRGGRPIPEVPVHATFEHTGARRELVHALVAPDGRAVELRADPAFRFTQLYLADRLATDHGPRRAVAVEPMTAPPNALRTGLGMRELEPGGTLRAGFGIRLRQPLSRLR